MPELSSGIQGVVAARGWTARTTEVEEQKKVENYCESYLFVIKRQDFVSILNCLAFIPYSSAILTLKMVNEKDVCQISNDRRKGLSKFFFLIMRESGKVILKTTAEVQLKVSHYLVNYGVHPSFLSTVY